MSSLTTLLQDADPLRHEAPCLDAERERIRERILRTPPLNQSTKSSRASVMLAAALAIAVAALGYVAWRHGTTPVLAAVRFEVRLAEDQPVPGLVVAQVAGSRRLLYLHPEIVVSNDDIGQTWVVQDGPDRFAIGVEFLPPGAERMRQATANHIGRPVAILVDGRVVIAPVVRARIGNSAIITGDYTQTDAERIASGMRTR
jgi:hypothetical protein